MNRTTTGGACALFLLICCANARATMIDYEVSNVGGTAWRYDYTLTNDALSSPLEAITIYFSLGLYQDIVIGGAPAGWDPLAIQPDPLLPDDGYFDVLALDAGLAPGATLGGFWASFTWLGPGTPGSQAFDVFDPLDYGTPLESGTTRLFVSNPPTSSVPEPGTMGLLLVGLLALRASPRGRSTDHRVD